VEFESQRTALKEGACASSLAADQRAPLHMPTNHARNGHLNIQSRKLGSVLRESGPKGSESFGRVLFGADHCEGHRCLTARVLLQFESKTLQDHCRARPRHCCNAASLRIYLHCRTASPWKTVLQPTCLDELRVGAAVASCMRGTIAHQPGWQMYSVR
jgi:hypothetical protein